MKLSHAVIEDVTKALARVATKHNAIVEQIEFSQALVASDVKINFTMREMTDTELLQMYRDGE